MDRQIEKMTMGLNLKIITKFQKKNAARKLWPTEDERTNYETSSHEKEIKLRI